MAFLAALRFLTVLPLPTSPPSPEELAHAPGYFPLVGFLIGLALAVLDAALRLFLPDSVVAALLIVALLAITGGLHIDGLADTCDGVFSNATPEERLEIMRDSCTGSFGVAGVATVLLVQYAALTNIAPGGRAEALVLMATLSRWAMSYALAAFPYARASGLGAPFRQGPPHWLGIATISCGLACLLLLRGAWGLPLLVVVWAATWGLARLLLQRLPGLTGDTYGAINEAIQALVLLALVAGSVS